MIVSALSWELIALFDLDLVAAILSMKLGEASALSSVVYGLWGLAGLYQVLTWKAIQLRSLPASAGAHA